MKGTVGPLEWEYRGPKRTVGPLEWEYQGLKRTVGPLEWEYRGPKRTVGPLEWEYRGLKSCKAAVLLVVLRHLPWHSQRSTCLCLPCAGIKGIASPCLA